MRQEVSLNRDFNRTLDTSGRVSNTNCISENREYNILQTYTK